MSKPLVFISHIQAEKDVAIAFQELIETSFLNMIEVFVSSDEKSISMGDGWVERITNALKACAVEIILCSPQSVARPWINFEAGAGWTRGVPVIPLCHSGMEKDNLPLPLKLRQGANAAEGSDLKQIFSVLAQAAGSRPPDVNFTKFIDKVRFFEKKYWVDPACDDVSSNLLASNTSLISPPPSDALPDIEEKILLLLLQHDKWETSQIAHSIGQSSQAALFHLTELLESAHVRRSLGIDRSRGIPIHCTYWRLEQEGRRYLAKRGLLK